MAHIYLGLGSNQGDREQSIYAALALLSPMGVQVGVASPLYETEPWGVVDQPRFLNGACAAETFLEPEDLLDVLKQVERLLGRVVTIRWGPRPIDLDLLLYDDLRLETARLVVPHPGMTERASVLVPLTDIAPEVIHPVTGLSIREHLERLGPLQGIAPFPPGLEVAS